jgi:hypothetical protein
VDYSFKLDEEFTMFYPILNETVKVSDVPKASVFLGAQLTARSSRPSVNNIRIK